ncbi:MAG: hypothetical protein NTY47_02525 [Candidatus Omnitrophica bacterium]|nr:hypothetical protein [Candidatus Omnitrophota bacterium]
MRVEVIKLPFKVKRSVLAVGSQAKNTVCFVRGSSAYISQVHQDLSVPQDLVDFEKDARYFLKKKPQRIAFDYHPEYSSSSFVLHLSSFVGRTLPVYHHHAHICACMAENGMKNQKVIGVAFDGTGLGLDNAIWGAEFLACDYLGFKRLAHLREIPLAGAGQAIFQPWRLAAFWLYRSFGDNFKGLGVSWLDKLDANKWRIIKDAAEIGINSPLTSSVGRLFDAAASLILGKMYAEYEAQLPIELERLALRRARDEGRGTILAYSFVIRKEREKYVIDPAGLFKGIISDLKKEIPKEVIAYKFHVSMAIMVKKVCVMLKKSTGINKIVLAGGVFQNKLLLELSQKLLKSSSFQVIVHKKLPANDASLSLGQAVIAAMRK